MRRNTTATHFALGAAGISLASCLHCRACDMESSQLNYRNMSPSTYHRQVIFKAQNQCSNVIVLNHNTKTANSEDSGTSWKSPPSGSRRADLLSARPTAAASLFTFSIFASIQTDIGTTCADIRRMSRNKQQEQIN